MNLNYKKNNNEILFSNFRNKELLNVDDPQNYIPLYEKFFSLNENNFSSINLNNKKRITEITEKVSENKYKIKYEDTETNNIHETELFFKLSPLLDPIKFLAGKYDVNDENIYKLPKLIDNSVLEKIRDNNNCSYVDGFFSYLSSQLYNNYGFLHGIDFYGSFLGIKNNYIIDICDDMEFLEDKDFFYKNINNFFHFLNPDYESIINNNSRDNKKRLEFDDDETDLMNIEELNNEKPIYDDLEKDFSSINMNEIDVDMNDEKNDKTINIDNSIDISDNTDNTDTIDDIVDNILESNNEDNISQQKELIFETLSLKDRESSKSKSNSSSSSSCSSRSSITNEESESNEDDEEEGESSESSSSEMEDVFVSIDKFPIQIIALEQCKNTLDYLLVEDIVNEEELGCIVIQILMILITYQKLFDFTHNDLHTNNIMYIETEKKYLYYKYNDKHYKVKTFGKIFKIIDFGRAIYKYKNHLMCSDSFHKDGDAATQYNFEPYYDNEKPIIQPNPSFDLCRLGCSMLDYIYELYDDIDKIKSPIHKIIINWCKDDKGRNVLYKNDGEERYPDFKLYKMIARKVHMHIPSQELKNKYFDRFVVGKKEINKSAKIFNIDTLEI